MKKYIFVFLILLFFLLPASYIIYQALYPFHPTPFQDLPPAILGALTGNTFFIVLNSSLLALALGLGCALVIVYYQFPGRRFLEAALCLPLAFPPYLLAAVYRELAHQYYQLGIEPEQPWFASLIFALNLYPYFYILLKMALENQSAMYSEAGKSLGLGTRQRLFKIILPLVKPALLLGLLLVVMEIVSDYGTVNLLGVRTLTTWIYNTWFNMNNPRLAAQLSLLLYVFPLLVILIFIRFYRQAAFYNPPNRFSNSLRRSRLGAKGAPAFFVILLPLLGGFVIPLGVLFSWAVPAMQTTKTALLFSDLGNTLLLALLVTVCCLVVALLFTWLKRYARPHPFLTAAGWIINLQYAVPGIVMGIALLVITGSFYDQPAIHWLLNTFGIIVIGCVMRYLCFAYFSLESGLKQIPFRFDEALAATKKGRGYTLLHLHLPMLSRSLVAGSILVFINVVKELTMSLILQPFNYSSLALRIYSFARMDQLKKSALYALFLVLIVLYPIFSMNRWFSPEERDK